MKRKNKILSMFFLLIMAVTSLIPIYAQSDSKQSIRYLLQKIEPPKIVYYISFKHGYTIPLPEAYHVVDETTLLDFFEQDTVDYNRATMLCDPGGMSMFSDSAVTRQSIRFSRIEDILFLTFLLLTILKCGEIGRSLSFRNSILISFSSSTIRTKSLNFLPCRCIFCNKISVVPPKALSKFV